MCENMQIYKIVLRRWDDYSLLAIKYRASGHEGIGMYQSVHDDGIIGVLFYVPRRAGFTWQAKNKARGL